MCTLSCTDNFQPYNRRNKKFSHKESKSADQIVQENIKKLLALSKPTADKAIVGKVSNSLLFF